MRKITLLFVALVTGVATTNIHGASQADSISVWVDGACGMCRDRIEETALKVRGVESAEWNGITKMLSVAHNGKLKEDRLEYALASVGHDTREYLAPEAVYSALPACCQYRTVEDHGLGSDEASTKVPAGKLVQGKVLERDGESFQPLPGTNVYWSGTNQGVTTDETGAFEIEMSPGTQILVFSFVGYGKDSVHVHEPTFLEIELSNTKSIEQVEIVYRREATLIDLSGAFDVQQMRAKELMKSACCNLSESFETNPNVDATVTDAVTGTRQIEMLGLAGQYVQINRENMPHIRGLSTLTGLGFVPGPWISGIQLNTGTGSVVNGFESITGQINVELKKPEDSEKLFVNLYGSTDGMTEFNANTATPVNDKFSTALLVHGKYQPFEFDHNQDGFMDHPAATSGILMNRWSFANGKGLTSVFGIKGVYSRTESGQVEYDHDLPADAQSPWGAAINTDRIEAFLKIGHSFPDRPYSSVGLQLSGMYHNQDAFFGRRPYLGEQVSLYANLVYMGIFGNTNHQYRTGASFQFDDYNESLSGQNYLRSEAIPGVFLEYTYNYLDKFTLVSGIRGDYHNIFGAFLTPRMHMRYAPVESTVFRAMIGRGQKTANVLAENLGYLASSREFIFETSNTGENLLTMGPEVAWNSGLNVGQEFTLAGRTGVAKVDYYYTWFSDQVIVNLDRTADAVVFQQLDGRSYSHSLQGQVNYELFRNYDLRLAYRLNDVKMDIDGELLQKAMMPRHRAFMNMAYETNDHWMFDMTVTWQGIKRIPNTGLNPEEFQLDNYSPNFFLWNAQVSKTFREVFDIYIGVENLMDYRQENPIIDAANPFGEHFDASLIWGPVFGRKVYAGIRFRIN